MRGLSELSVDELADGICLRAGRIAAAQVELLLWIAEFDRREGWGRAGMLSCAHWLSWRIGLSLGTARDQVRVARRLEELPQVAAAFGDGRVSYSKVRAITRVAQDGDGVDWVDLARHSSAAQLDKIVRGVRRARANEAASADPEAAAWAVRTRVRYDDDGNFVLTISGPAEFLPVVRAGLDAKKAELQRERDAASEDDHGGRDHGRHEDGGREDGGHEDGGHEDVLPALPDVPGPDGVTGQAPPPSPAGDSAAPAAPAAAAPVEPVEPVEPAAPVASAASAASVARAQDEPSLEEQAPGWPAGSTRAWVGAAMEGFFALQDRLRAEQAELDDALRPEQPPAAGRQPSTASSPDDAAPTAERAAVSDAEALLALAQDALQAEKTTRPDVARRRRPHLTAQIDPLSGWARQADGELLPPSSLRAVLKTLPGRGGLLRLRPVTEADLRRFDLGRTSRDTSAALRELLGVLDGERCRFPGCTRHAKLHAHHVVYWSDGGPTDLANLVLMCSRHHTLLHAHGFQLRLHPDRRLEVRTADGVRVLHHPAQPWGDPAALASGCGQLVSAETLPPDHCHPRLDLGYAVSVLMAQAS
jgi:hypothetical protein